MGGKNLRRHPVKKAERVTTNFSTDEPLERLLRKILNECIEAEAMGKTPPFHPVPGLDEVEVFNYLTGKSSAWPESANSHSLRDLTSLTSMSRMLEKTADRLINIFFQIGPPLASDRKIWDIINKTTAARYGLLSEILAQVSEI